jgi:hypothetical protein
MASMGFVEGNNALYIKGNEIKKFKFRGNFIGEAWFTTDSEDIKIGYVELGDGFSSIEGTVEISCRDGAKVQDIPIKTFVRHSITGEIVEGKATIHVIDDSFTTTTSPEAMVTTASNTYATTYVTYDATTTTAIACFGPKISGAERPMMQGEVRKIYVVNPETGIGKGIKFGKYSDNIEVEYHEGDDFLIVSAKSISTGEATIEGVTAEGCSFTTTINLTINDGHQDYQPIVNYDSTPIRVGESKKIYFEHPVKGKVSGHTANLSDNIMVTYNKGDDFFTVKATKEGRADLSFYVDGCQFSGFANFEIVPEDANIITGIESAPDKIIYKSGEKLDLTGLKANVSTPDGKNEVLDLSKLADGDYAVSDNDYMTRFANKQFDSSIGGRFYIALNEGEDKEFTFGGKRYYFYQKDTSFPVYTEGSYYKYLELKNAAVTSANYGSDKSGLSFKGIEQKFRIDADSAMHADWSMSRCSFLKEDDIISGVLQLNAAGDYIITGDITKIGIVGDANYDGGVDLSDAVIIMQSIANPDKYGVNGSSQYHIPENGTICGDMDGDGLTNADALAIQKKLLKIK